MKIKFTGDTHTNHSLAIVNKNIVEYLKKVKEILLVEDDTIDVEIRHSYPPKWNPSKAKVLIFIQEWEFERCPLEWVINFNAMANRLIVPSDYLKNIYEEAGIRIPISVIPNGCDTSVFKSIGKPITKPFKFLYIGSYQFRKGYDILKEVWETYFKDNSNIELHIKDMSHVYGKKNGKVIERINASNTFYYDDEMSIIEMATLYQKCDCLICCSRGESYCMPIAEAISCGLDLICPKEGPYKEIVSKQSSFVLCKKTVVDPYQTFIGKKGDSFTNMGSHFHVYEVIKEDLARLIYEKKDKKEKHSKQKILNWTQVGKKYFNIIKYEFNKNI